MFRSLKGYLSPGPVSIHECRRCGTDVDATTRTCPTCGAEEIAHLHIE